MGTLQYRKCIACQKGFNSPSSAKRRVHDTEIALQYRPLSENWHDVRWSDECHFAITPEGRVLVIRKPGERYCPDCIQYREEIQSDAAMYRFHIWAAVGWHFKSKLFFYQVPTNTNGKMSHQVYRDEILEKMVKPWLESGQDFVLEEDGDSGHGGGRAKNIVKVWNEEYRQSLERRTQFETLL